MYFTPSLFFYCFLRLLFCKRFFLDFLGFFGLFDDDMVVGIFWS